MGDVERYSISDAGSERIGIQLGHRCTAVGEAVCTVRWKANNAVKSASVRLNTLHIDKPLALIQSCFRTDGNNKIDLLVISTRD